MRSERSTPTTSGSGSARGSKILTDLTVTNCSLHQQGSADSILVYLAVCCLFKHGLRLRRVSSSERPRDLVLEVVETIPTASASSPSDPSGGPPDSRELARAEADNNLNCAGDSGPD
jgi:hypothetical protein